MIFSSEQINKMIYKWHERAAIFLLNDHISHFEIHWNIQTLIIELYKNNEKVRKRELFFYGLEALS